MIPARMHGDCKKLVLLGVLLGVLGGNWRHTDLLFSSRGAERVLGVGTSPRIWGWSLRNWRSAESGDVSRGRTQLFALNSSGSGSLVTAGRIDREWSLYGDRQVSTKSGDSDGGSSENMGSGRSEGH